jgi:3',5'-nucleoside bisphosphate phosphatase
MNRARSTMQDFRADLHCHTDCSDGSLSPEQILKLAVDIGLKGLSITDHDSIDAYASALPLSKELGIELISGAEFSSIEGAVSIHLLGYSFDLKSQILMQFCKKHNQRRENRNRSILEQLTKYKMPVTEEEVNDCAFKGNPLARRTIGRPHIAQAMIKKGYVRTVAEAFQKYLGEGKLCFAPGESFSVEETIDVIHKAKGLAVIAHPHLIHHPETLKKLLELEFDGIECYYGKFSPSDHKRWLKIAEKKNWLITGGSDFHGDIKPGIPLGCSWVPEETFRILQKHFLQQITIL